MYTTPEIPHIEMVILVEVVEYQVQVENLEVVCLYKTSVPPHDRKRMELTLTNLVSIMIIQIHLEVVIMSKMKIARN